MHVGFGASGRNTGFLCSQVGTKTFEEYFAKFGSQKALKILQLGREAVDHVVDLVRTEGIDCELSQTGFAFTATSKSQLKKIRKVWGGSLLCLLFRILH